MPCKDINSNGIDKEKVGRAGRVGENKVLEGKKQ